MCIKEEVKKRNKLRGKKITRKRRERGREKEWRRKKEEDEAVVRGREKVKGKFFYCSNINSGKA